jgi:hypothetical protein
MHRSGRSAALYFRNFFGGHSVMVAVLSQEAQSQSQSQSRESPGPRWRATTRLGSVPNTVSLLLRAAQLFRSVASQSNAPQFQNGLPLLRFPKEDSKANYLAAFWQWVQLLANDDYAGALDALYWDTPTTWTAETLKEHVTTFFGGDDPWSVVIPNQRLVNVIGDACEIEPPADSDRRGWFMAQIPITTKPDDPLDDEISLMGLASSFFVREIDGEYVLEHEMFHV